MDDWDLSTRTDLRAAQDFASRMWNTSPFWHAGGLAWDFGPIVDTPADRRTHLWGRPDRVVAMADCLESTHLDAQVDPDEAAVVGEIIAWFERKATRNELTISFAEGHDWIRDAAWAAGYLEAPDLPFGLDMRMAPETVSFIELPEGYSVKSIDADCVDARVDVHRAAWEPSLVTREVYERVMVTWPYREVFDIVAVAPNGTFAACCIGWLDPTTRVAEIEPVGTHPDHRRLGLAQAVCAEAIERLSVAGCEEVVIKPRGDDAYPVPRQVYAGMGFEVVNRTRTFRKRR
jgi:ribosomal protein S18 acetylase RimI-like enzyme